MTRSSYDSASAFRQALSDRLTAEANRRGVPKDALLRRLVIERFAVRLAQHTDEVAITGGTALALRRPDARATKDLDLAYARGEGQVQKLLSAAACTPMADFLRFELQPARTSIIESPGVAQGYRIRVQAALADRPLGRPFGVDVELRRTMRQAEPLPVGDALQFVGLRERVRVAPLEEHIADKLHAYSRPRSTANTRVRDLPDLALLGGCRVIDAYHQRMALRGVFQQRATHPVPKRLPEPPSEWTRAYARLAQQERLPWPTLDEAHRMASALLDPVLAGSLGRWDPDALRWGTPDPVRSYLEQYARTRPDEPKARLLDRRDRGKELFYEGERTIAPRKRLRLLRTQSGKRLVTLQPLSGVERGARVHVRDDLSVRSIGREGRGR